MNILYLAMLELERENIKINNPKYSELLIDRAKTIRKFFDNSARNKKVLESRYNNKV